MKKIACLIIGLCLFSCNKGDDKVKPKNENVEKIKIDTRKTSEGLSVFDSKELIKIKGESIGKIVDLKVLDNENLVIKTASGKTRVYIYDLKKEKLIPVANKGDGPSELFGTDDVFIHSDNIYVLDKMKKHIYSYDVNGVFLEKNELPDYYQEMIMLKDQLFGLKTIPVNFKNDYKINVLEKTEKEGYVEKYKQHLIAPLAEERDLPHNNPLYVFNNKLHLAESFNDTLYNISNKGELIPKYFLDFSPYKFPHDLYNKRNLKLFEFVETVRKRDKYVWGVSYFFENSNYIFMKYFLSPENKPHFSYFDKKTNKSYTYQTINLEKHLGVDDIEIGPDFFPAYINEGYLYFIVEPYYLLELYKSKASNENALQNISYDDNPLIVKFKLK
jgi:hypothetical protein